MKQPMILLQERFNRLTHTKSNEELESLFQTYKEVRINAGAKQLLRTESDGGGDRSLWPEYFPELKEKTRPYKPNKINGLPLATISHDEIKIFYDVSAAANWAMSMNIMIEQHSKIHYGLDMEWNVDETRHLSRTIQLSFDPIP